MGFRYRVYGFTIDSEIELPELRAAVDAPDVVIRYGDAPERLEGPGVLCRRRYQATAGQYLLNLPRIARYWVHDGREVVVSPVDGAAEDDIRLYLLSSSMAALAHQRGTLIMHASAVEVGTRCVLFAGKAGAGKSTLAAAFHARGYRVVADDISAVSFDEGESPVVHHGYPSLKLLTDALEPTGVAIGANRMVRGKHSIAVSGPASPAPLPLARVFLLARRPGETSDLRPLAGASRVSSIADCSYRRPMAVALGQARAHFTRCAALASRVPIVTVSRTAALADLSTLVDRLEADILGASEDPA